MPLGPDEAAALVCRARDGDQQAWDGLVDAYVGLIWAIARNHRLSPGDGADVTQTTWLRLLENIDRLEDPSRVGAWLATTARRECLRTIRLGSKQVLVGEEARLDVIEPDGVPVDGLLLRAEEAVLVREALHLLPERCQELLRLLMVDDPPSYEEVSAALGMPVGSIGPTRGRCLDKLRVLAAERGLSPGG